MNTELWLKKAQDRITGKVKLGKKFELRDLFETVEWEELSKGERIQFGREFSNAVKEGQIPLIERVQKAQNNHTQYVKVRE